MTSWRVIFINFSIARKPGLRNLVLNSFVYKSTDCNREYVKYKCYELLSSYPSNFTNSTATMKYFIGFVSITNAQNFLLFRSRRLNWSIFSKVSIILFMFELLKACLNESNGVSFVKCISDIWSKHERCTCFCKFLIFLKD